MSMARACCILQQHALMGAMPYSNCYRNKISMLVTGMNCTAQPVMLPCRQTYLTMYKTLISGSYTWLLEVKGTKMDGVL